MFGNGQLPWWMHYMQQNPQIMQGWFKFVQDKWAERNPGVAFPAQWQQRWDQWQQRFPANGSGATSPAQSTPPSSSSGTPPTHNNFSSYVHQMREAHPEGGLGQYIRQSARPEEWQNQNQGQPPMGFRGANLGKKKGLL